MRSDVPTNPAAHAGPKLLFAALALRGAYCGIGPYDRRPDYYGRGREVMPVMKKRFLVSGLVTAASAAGLAASPTAAADCTSSGGITICAQGNVTGPSGVPTSSSPYYPYPCDDDWLCDDGGVSLVIDPGPPNGGIDIGLPGRPGNRPGR